MKFFQSLLVAPAVLGFLTPLTADATNKNLYDSLYYQESSIPSFDSIYKSDWSYKAITNLAKSRGCLNSIPNRNISRFEAASIINSCLSNVPQLTEIDERLIEEFKPELALIKSRVDGIEPRMSEFEAGVFSPTTSASFSVDMAIGAVDGNSNEEKLGAIYGYQIDLTTSFTGEDSLDISLDAGSGGHLSELDLNATTDDALVVDGISYTFPLGDKTTVFFGDSMDGSTLYSTACTYGGPTNALDDCGNYSSALAAGKGTTFGASYDFGNGFTAAIGYEGQGSSSSGLMTLQGEDAYGGQVAYSSDSYGISLTYGLIEAGIADTTHTALNGYFTPEGNFPSISVGYEWSHDDSAPSSSDTSSHYFVGLMFDEVGPGTFGAALGTKTPSVENVDDQLMYEAFYSYPINDGMTITPLVYVKEVNGGDNETALMVKSSFTF